MIPERRPRDHGPILMEADVTQRHLAATIERPQWGCDAMMRGCRWGDRKLLVRRVDHQLESDAFSNQWTAARTRPEPDAYDMVNAGALDTSGKKEGQDHGDMDAIT